MSSFCDKEQTEMEKNKYVLHWIKVTKLAQKQSVYQFQMDSKGRGGPRRAEAGRGGGPLRAAASDALVWLQARTERLSSAEGFPHTGTCDPRFSAGAEAPSRAGALTAGPRRHPLCSRRTRPFGSRTLWR